MCRNSFGPCAFDFGPSNPVIRNCAAGKRSPSMPMNGIVPPVPMYIDGLPKNACDAFCIEVSSHSATGGAFQPAIVDSTWNDTFESGGVSASSMSLTVFAASSASQVGGRRNDSFSVLNGSCTLPASTSAGSPDAPVTLMVGRQVLFNSSSYGDSLGAASSTAH